MKIPSVEQCYKVFEDYSVPAPIRNHCEKVTEVGLLIGRQLHDSGVEINIPLLEAGCLLHDAFKAASLKSLDPKPEWGYYPTNKELKIWEELREQYKNTHETLIVSDMFKETHPEFAAFLGMIGSTGNPCYLEGGIELKVLHYADWRVQFVEIVSFDARLDYLRETYRESWEKHGVSWDKRYEQEKELERHIFKNLEFSPDDLNKELRNSL
ncbi:HD domain-containing protein [Prodigiosinella aquatilis]|nr:HD domain-containing protein [Prodigiosinella sp. LS101]WJV54878.1 HD domain-containing protein [Prodigiosinella sp. LS101]WJV59241.1 HD domain-containing protein [Pectobacteriaceae bacterium C111]